MEDPEPLTPFEKALTKMLGEHKPESCLSAEELIELAELGRRCPGYDARMSHVATCSLCFGLFRDVRRMEKARAQANGSSENPAGRKKLRRTLLLLVALALATACGLALMKIWRPEALNPAQTT